MQQKFWCRSLTEVEDEMRRILQREKLSSGSEELSIIFTVEGRQEAYALHVATSLPVAPPQESV